MVHLPDAFTAYIRQNFYGKVTEQSTLEAIVNDDSFLQNPLKHVALFSDHGIVHGNDIARKIEQVLQHIHGVLIPERSQTQLEFMLGYGVMLAYLHDIGMRDFSAFGRAMHPEFAAQLIYSQEFAPLVDLLWQENAGNVPWRLTNLSLSGVLPQEPQLVLREMLSLSIGHSKSKIAIATLNHPQALRATMQECLGSDLQYLHCRQQVAKAEAKLAQGTEQNIDADLIEILTQHLEDARKTLMEFTQSTHTRTTNPDLDRYYPNFAQTSFQWLISPHPELKQLVQDVIDTIRALRCADALRQRGHSFRTSAGYEVLVNQHTAHAVYALHTCDGAKLFLLEGKDAISSGEANMTSCELDQDRNLRVSFERGCFSTPEATRWAIYSAALVTNDIQADVVGSFARPRDASPPEVVGKAWEDIQILIEGVDDNPEFAQAVCQELGRMNRAIAHRCCPVASLQKADLAEVARYLSGTTPIWHLDEQNQLIAEIAKTGQKIDQLDLARGLRDVKLITIQAGEVLMEQGSPASFVYIPMNQGLKVFPSGGYAITPAQAWMQLGDTAAIKGSVRNARVIAERETHLLMIPKQVYLQYWYNPYSLDEFVQLFDQGDGSILRRRHLLTPISIQKKQIKRNRRQRVLPLALQLNALFHDFAQVKTLLTYLEKLDLSQNPCLFQQGDAADALYIVEMGQVELSIKQYGGQPKTQQLCNSGDLIGEIDFYTQACYQTTAIATPHSQVYQLTRAALKRLQQEHPTIALGFSDIVLAQIANRLAESNPSTDSTAPSLSAIAPPPALQSPPPTTDPRM
jgi:CRP-like cAMP-binding protein